MPHMWHTAFVLCALTPSLLSNGVFHVQGANVAEDVRNEYNWRVRRLASHFSLVGMRLHIATPASV